MKSRIDPTKRPTRSQHDRQSDSKTLRNELENLVGLVQQYSPNWIDTDPVRNNAYVEAFAVHCRALIFFLYGHLEEITAKGKTERFSPLRENDVIAYDYYPSWSNDCPPPTDVLVDAKWQADKHVAHITEERREVNQPGSSKDSVWKLGRAASVICTVMELFLRKAPVQGFDASESDQMKSAISGLLRPDSPSQVPPMSAPFGAVAQAPASYFQAKTDARTISPQPSVNIHGKTG
jgi:hypothetical protein